MQFIALIFFVPLQSGVPHFPAYRYIKQKKKIDLKNF